MNNQHAGLSQVLAGQRITERHEQAAHARLLRGLARRVAAAPGGRPVAGGSWPAGRASPPISQSVTPARQLIDRRPTTSKLARALILGAMLIAARRAGRRVWAGQAA